VKECAEDECKIINTCTSLQMHMGARVRCSDAHSWRWDPSGFELCNERPPHASSNRSRGFDFAYIHLHVSSPSQYILFARWPCNWEGMSAMGVATPYFPQPIAALASVHHTPSAYSSCGSSGRLETAQATSTDHNLGMSLYSCTCTAQHAIRLGT